VILPFFIIIKSGGKNMAKKQRKKLINKEFKQSKNDMSKLFMNKCGPTPEHLARMAGMR